MQKRRLGKSDIAITPLMLGGNVFGWTADEANSFAILDAFVAQGGDAIDTADVYSSWAPGHQGGESERVIGAWLKRSGKRNSVMIGTKVGMWTKHLGLKRDTIIAACEDSLKRLGIETIDLYWLHRDDEATPAEEYVAGLEHLVKAGKVRAIGASNFKPARFSEGVAEAARRDLHFDAQQPEYNLMNREIEAELMPLCVREEVSLLPYYGLANGFLTGKYRSAEDKSKSLRGGRMDKYLNEKGFAVLGALDHVAGRHNATPAQVALAWVMAQPAIAAPIASATNAAQLNELMGALRLSLTVEDIAALNAAGG